MSSQLLELLPWRLAVCRLAPDAPVPEWALGGSFQACLRTPEELTVICEQGRPPGGVQAEREFRVLRVAGTLDFALVGVLSELLAPLAEAAVSVFALSTYDTDYLLVKGQALDEALAALQSAGHRIHPVETT